MLKRKWVTWLLIGMIGILPLPAIVQYLQTYIVRNAVVTAFRYEVNAPIDGVVKTLNAHQGLAPDNMPVLRLENLRLPFAEISSLKAGYHEKQKYYRALGKELALLNARLTQNQQQQEDYLAMIQKDLELNLAILKSRLEGEAARFKERDQAKNRILSLVKTSAAAQEDADRIEAEFQEARAKVNTTQLEIIQTRHYLKMLENNLFPPNLSDGVLQVQNQINRLDLDICDARRRMHRVKADLVTDAARLKALQTDLEDKLSRTAVTLPGNAVIWETDVTENMEVAKGDRMLSYIDRDNLMVDVAVDDASLELIHPDHPVRIRLFGSGRFIKGRVIQVMGSSGTWPAHCFAAGLPLGSARNGHVLVAINDPQLRDDVKRLCGVGRTAYAEFEGIGLIEQYFGTFLR